MTIRYVNTASTAGGDGTTNATTGANRAYATLAEAETALQAVLTEDMNILCAGATADARTTFDGWTAGSFRIYIKGNPDDAAGVHVGIWDVNKYRITAASGTLATLEIIEDSVTVSRIQLTTTHLDGMAVGRAGPVGLAFIADSLVLKGSGTTSSSIGAALADLNNTNVKVRNCIAYDWVIGIYTRQEAAGAGDSFIVNNTVHSCAQGIRGHDNSGAATYIQAVNNLSVGNTSDWLDTGGAFDQANSVKNAFRNTGAACPGATDIDLSTYLDADIFVDAANDNFHLLTTGSAYALVDNDGIGPASNAEVPTTDIDGNARSGTTTSVGADIIVSGGLSATVGQVTETDTAQVVAHLKFRSIGQVTETNVSQAITPRKIVAVAQVTETDLAQGITWSPKRRLLNQVTETDTAQAVTRVKAKTIGQVSEADAAQAITRRKSAIIVQAIETDTAQAVAASSKTKAIGQVVETDSALGATPVKRLAVNQVIEIDIAQAIVWAPKRRLVAQVIELDAAQAITVIGGAAPVLPEVLETIITASPNITTVTAVSLSTLVTASSVETRITKRLIETGVQSV